MTELNSLELGLGLGIPEIFDDFGFGFGLRRRVVLVVYMRVHSLFSLFRVFLIAVSCMVCNLRGTGAPVKVAFLFGSCLR